MLDFDFFYRWVRDNLNIDLNAYKDKQLQRRIGTIMKSSGADNLREYARLIDRSKEIEKIFLDYITINVTEFFRNRDIFDEFELILRDQLAGEFGSLKIWSAACSIGSEPYSIAMILDRNNIRQDGKILATDIDRQILKRAREGIYKESEMKNITREEINQYFTIRDKEYHLSERIKSMVRFKQHDLILDRYERGFHAVVCRNVTIYFKNQTKNDIYRKIHKSLVPGGVFFTGATESIYDPRQFGFEKISTFIYKKI